jgi:TatD DNase family protein
MIFFDSHAHITSEEMVSNSEQVVAQAKEAGLVGIANICTDKKSLEEGILLAKKYSGYVFNVGATTPHDVEKEGEEMFSVFREAAVSGDLVAIGETGLDYYYTLSKKEIQKEYLRKYFRLAKELALPVVIHCREAFSDFFEILDEEFKVGGEHLKGVLHCFTGTLEEAHSVIERGWYLSLSGIVTYKKSEALRKVAEYVPLNQLLIETDAPYLAPQKYRGQLNTPAYIVETAQQIASVKNISLNELATVTTENAERIFKCLTRKGERKVS